MEYNVDNKSLKYTTIHLPIHLLRHSLVTGNNAMAFNLALFEADFSVDEYTADVEAEFLHPFHFDREKGDDDHTR